MEEPPPRGYKIRRVQIRRRGRPCGGGVATAPQKNRTRLAPRKNPVGVLGSRLARRRNPYGSRRGGVGPGPQKKPRTGPGAEETPYGSPRAYKACGPAPRKDPRRGSSGPARRSRRAEETPYGSAARP